MASALIEFSNELANAVERGGKAVVAIKEGGRNGVSGTVWRKDIVVAAEHTIRGRDQVTVVLPSGEEQVASITGGDPSTDIAVVKVTGVATTELEFGDPAQLKVGNLVLALGRRDQSLAASYGIVSALGGAWRTGSGGRIDQWLRLDLNPYPGFSGGPLVNAIGQILGINTSGPRRTVTTIPRSTVDRVADQLVRKGRITRGYVGIGGQPVTIPPAVREKSALTQSQGLLVITIASGGPAEKGGVTVGDIILTVDDKQLAEPMDLLAALDPDTVGKTLPLRLLRGGTPTEVSVMVAERERP